MEDQTEVAVSDQGEKPIRAVAGPLHEERGLSSAYLRLHEERSFPEDANRETCPFEKSPVGGPARLEGLFGVVKQIDVSRNPWGVQE